MSADLKSQIAISKPPLRAEDISQRIHTIRGHRVMLDADLAEPYGVTTTRLNEQVKRNQHRFPKDFMFRLNAVEKAEVVAKCDNLSRIKFSPVSPNVFTEHGALMVASVLNTQRAIEVSVFVVRAFVSLRNMCATHKEIAHRLNELEQRIGTHDKAIRSLMDAIRQLMEPPKTPRRRIGF